MTDAVSESGSEKPTPPAALEDDLREALETLSERELETIDAVATYAAELAAWAETTKRAATRPDGVPERATVSETEIGGTTYRYYQWRKGDDIRSETVELE
ncbi:hypothetical protein [Natronobacterium gregoryi]|uniref:Uncharacterized protein n=2 Tax=Natronobacterium gregoryi TaxID=44930 RepID=L0AK26_NATGS|nr:hypothetical protein [Natronobacterium gregoryi]AFZ74243.1 hypothetical protein Natgr_3112 [Natronobacterium gregoryi SP2]ELY63701.1 hypothetical protein C490_15664 [Natronobacterium gregoryi SP2]PLK21972.1 hypothetical protein CYV19_00810 [Natronobacterium gregoryi SP2]SFI52214.1 hypothetical protein SAMN05443661_101131 [Natronobacterium gregoryi]